MIVWRRNMIGSDTVIVLVAFMHLWEGVAAAAAPADTLWAIPMDSLLFVLSSRLISPVLIVAALIALFGHFWPPLTAHTRLALLIPQQTLLLITCFGAVYWIGQGHYADEAQLHPWLGMTCDQFPRLGAPLVYTSAMLASIRRGQWK